MADQTSNTADDGAATAPAPLLHHILLVSILLMGLVLIAGLGLVIYGFVGTLSTEEAAGTGPATDRAPYRHTVSLPAASTVVESFALGERLALRVRTPDGDLLLLIDPASGREVGRIRLVATDPAP